MFLGLGAVLRSVEPTQGEFLLSVFTSTHPQTLNPATCFEVHNIKPIPVSLSFTRGLLHTVSQRSSQRATFLPSVTHLLSHAFYVFTVWQTLKPELARDLLCCPSRLTFRT